MNNNNYRFVLTVVDNELLEIVGNSIESEEMQKSVCGLKITTSEDFEYIEKYAKKCIKSRIKNIEKSGKKNVNLSKFSYLIYKELPKIEITEVEDNGEKIIITEEISEFTELVKVINVEK